MTDYVPGQKIKEFIKAIQPPSDYDADFEYGFYDGDYAVIDDSTVHFRPELEKIRTAALTLWQDQLITFPDIINWVKSGAKDPVTHKETLQVAAGDEQRKTVVLIDNGVFVRHW
ncbi:MAG: hypothetical protein F4X56_00880 [Gammaproteobacteria bacterium]|nr:hypothetical protein [Gammaproteobacteria bacterium]MYC24454.1 hypothetical protein [Gammaproteobacteria bacterium]